MTTEVGRSASEGRRPRPSERTAPASPAGSEAAAGLVSVLMPCCGQIEFTRLSVPRVLRCSRSPYEIVFLDVDSLDGTRDYLAGVAAAAPVRVDVVTASLDAGLPEACRDVFARARGEFLVLLSNDTLVTEGWLEHLVTLATLHPDIGLVGPVSNYAPPLQLVEKSPCRIPVKKDLRSLAGTAPAASSLELEAVDRYAREWQEQNRTRWIEVEQLAGFCLLLKREVLQTTGLFDARPAGLEFFDAQALSLRARQCGYRLACCRDVFVYHFGSRIAAPRQAAAGDPPPGPPGKL